MFIDISVNYYFNKDFYIVVSIVDFEWTFLDYPDSSSEALLVRFSGCDLNCPNCQNKELQKYDVGVAYTKEGLLKTIEKLMSENYVDKLIFSGGDPLSSGNIEATKWLLKNLNCDVCVYTGNIVNYCKHNELEGFTYLKCGMFDESKLQKSYKDDNLFTLASTNQKFYNSEYKQLSEDGALTFEKE